MDFLGTVENCSLDKKAMAKPQACSENKGEELLFYRRKIKNM